MWIWIFCLVVTHKSRGSLWNSCQDSFIILKALVFVLFPLCKSSLIFLAALLLCDGNAVCSSVPESQKCFLDFDANIQASSLSFTQISPSALTAEGLISLNVSHTLHPSNLRLINQCIVPMSVCLICHIYSSQRVSLCQKYDWSVIQNCLLAFSVNIDYQWYFPALSICSCSMRPCVKHFKSAFVRGALSLNLLSSVICIDYCDWNFSW